MNNYIRTLGTAALLALFGLTMGSCSRDSKLSNAEPAIVFTQKGVVPLSSQASYAKKRGFADFNRDNITDMVEVNDESVIGQDWKARIFYGQKGKDGKIRMKDTPVILDLPIKKGWFTSQTKLDTGDVNGDGLADIILTQYTEGLLSDKFYIAIAVNQGNEKGFKLVEDITRDGVAFSEAFLRFVDAMDDDVSDIDKWLKMDWADVDGDKKDDLILCWLDYNITSGNDLYVEVWYSATKKAGEGIKFSGDSHTTLKQFMHRVSIKYLDTGDLNGDGLADIMIYDPHIGTSIEISTAINESNGRQVSYRIHKDSKLEEIEVDTVAFEKRDSFDVNLDGCDDYVHAGRKSGTPILSYILVKCEKKKIECGKNMDCEKAQ